MALRKIQINICLIFQNNISGYTNSVTVKKSRTFINSTYRIRPPIPFG